MLPYPVSGVNKTPVLRSVSLSVRLEIATNKVSVSCSSCTFGSQHKPAHSDPHRITDQSGSWSYYLLAAGQRQSLAAPAAGSPAESDNLALEGSDRWFHFHVWRLLTGGPAAALPFKAT